MNAEAPRQRRIGVRPENDAPEARATREKQWLAENKEAIADYNRWIEENGLPFDEYRQV